MGLKRRRPQTRREAHGSKFRVPSRTQNSTCEVGLSETLESLEIDVAFLLTVPHSPESRQLKAL